MALESPIRLRVEGIFTLYGAATGVALAAVAFYLLS